MAGEASSPFLKYALFCRDTAEEDGGDLTLKGIVDLFELPEPDGSADPENPVLFSSYQIEGLDGGPTPPMTGCHQPVELVRGTDIPCAWFANGLQVLDISDPFHVKQAAWYMPDVPQGFDRVSSNDVFEDDRGLIYLLDRNRGLSIVERA